MIIIKDLTIKNFLSVGAVTQSLNFDRSDLTLILGENQDLGGAGNRNGVGKTVSLQALSYALFGVSINSIKKDNLINRTNGKGMIVTLTFSVDGVQYKIERGRKPNTLKFFINNALQKSQDDSQGDSRETQLAIEKIINMTSDMFRHIVALNTYSEPFLALKANDQRDIIEQLLGVTMLSEKAEIVKTMLATSKDTIRAEEFRIKAIEESNKRMHEQIEILKRRQKVWVNKHDNDLVTLVEEYEKLSKVNIEEELATHKALAQYNESKKINDSYDALIIRQTVWKDNIKREIIDLEKLFEKKNSIDIDTELEKHALVTKYNTLKRDKADQDAELSRLTHDCKRVTSEIKTLNQDLSALYDHKCYACGQELHDDNHSSIVSVKETQLKTANENLQAYQAKIEKLKAEKITLPKMPATVYKTEAEAIKHHGDLENLKQKIADKKVEVDPYQEQINELRGSVVPLGTQPSTIYSTEAEAVMHSSALDSVLVQITNKNAEEDPYVDQILDMEKQALQEINFDLLNSFSKTMDHQKFLLDMLVGKDSVVRKKIIDQNLAFLNARLTHYLELIGLPHEVVFKNDLTVEITELGRDLDFGNLSRGESNRLIISLSLAFKDVWENIYKPINLLFIDELLDSGMDTVGTENALSILKDMTRTRHKSVWLISHKDELISRVNNILRVVKSNGFTEYQLG